MRRASLDLCVVCFASLANIQRVCAKGLRVVLQSRATPAKQVLCLISSFYYDPTSILFKCS